MNTFSMVIFLILAIFSVVFFFLFLSQKQKRRQLEHDFAALTSRFAELEAKVEEGRVRLEGTFAGMVEGVLLTGHRGDILHVNPAFREMFGLKDKIEGCSALQVLASVASDDAIQKVLTTGEAVEREIEFTKPDRRVFQVHFSPMRRDGKLTGVVSVFHDLTEIRRLEQVRRDFVANLSHELKTPLTAIRGYSETLLDEFKGEETVKDHIAVIFHHAAHLTHLMENLLNLSRIESGKEEVLLESVPLKPFADRLLERFAGQAKVKEIQMRNEISEGTVCQADPNKLNQIVSNLVDNALKYSPEKSRIRIGCECSPKECKIEVEDNGPGIPASDRERIFERFYRVDKARSRDSGGAGLGLAIAKHLTELHGGRISVASASGSGSKFTVLLPH